jgi:hypothetical protein
MKAKIARLWNTASRRKTTRFCTMFRIGRKCRTTVRDEYLRNASPRSVVAAACWHLGKFVKNLVTVWA